MIRTHAGLLAAIGILLVGLSGCVTLPRNAIKNDRERVTEGLLDDSFDLERESDPDVLARRISDLLSDTLLLNEARQIAVLNNRHLAAAFEELGIARASMMEATARENPVIHVDPEFSDHVGDAEYHYGLEFALLDLLSIPSRRKSALLGLEAASLRTRAAVLDLYAAVSRAWYSAVADHQAWVMLQNAARTAEAGLLLAQEMRRAGNLDDAAFLAEQILGEEIRLEVREADTKRLASRELLNRLMGLWGTQASPGAWQLPQTLPSPPLIEVAVDRLEAAAIESNLELPALAAEAESYKSDERTSRVAAITDGFEVSWEAEKKNDAWQTKPGFSLPLPLLNMGQADALSFQSLSRMRELDHQAYAVNLRSHARDIARRLLTARETAIGYRDSVLPLQSRLTVAMQQKYNAMQIGTHDLLAAKRQELESGRRFLQALSEYWSARADVDALISGHLSKSDS